jgi:hypothetical protein
MIVFWLLAGMVKWVDSLWIDHWEQVHVLFFYFPALGILLSALLTLFYQAGWFRRLKLPLVWMAFLTLLAGMGMTAVLNPMAYLILGIDMASRHLEVFSRGALMHGLFFLAWSLAYFYLAGRPTTRPSPARDGDYINRISVEERGRVRTLPVDEIECILASGDYIEIHRGDDRFLKRETIAAMEQVLDPHQFSRVHRSTIINRQRVTVVRSGGNSTYVITLQSGRIVQSSRSYRAAIRSISMPEAPSTA